MKQISEIISMLPIILERVSIRLFSTRDISDDYISWLNDPEVMKFSNQRFSSHNRKTCEDFFNSIQSLDAIFLVIIFKENKEAVGTMTVYFSRNHQTADIGIMLGNKAFWDTGLGTEALDGVMEFLFKKVGIRKVTSGTLSCNKGMIRICEKAGMVPDGVRKNQELIKDKPYDIVYFAKFMS
jgi:[ribosomal protein S5]-alanine N-acetyltransferase